MKTAADILARFAARLTTRRAVCQAGLTPRMPDLLAELLPPGRWLLVADEHTWAAQGDRLADALARAAQPADSLILRPSAGRDELVCQGELVGQVEQATRLETGRPFVALVAVGSGTICDTVKLAAAAVGLPNAAVATAPSMNGYPSLIAAVLRDGVKVTEPTTPPVIVLADLDVLAAAPARMIAAGMADLLAKPVSTADWTLAAELLGDTISTDGLAVVEQSAALADGIAAALPARRPDAIARLFEALFVSGLAMAVSGASSPASGGEHLISHYLDMTALAAGREHDLHGLQVGLGTLVTAEMYRRLPAWDGGQLDVAARVAAQATWQTLEQRLHAHFGRTLAPPVIRQARRLHVEGDALADRLRRFRAAWPALRGKLAGRLAGLDAIAPQLVACGAATRFEQIGVGQERALAAATHAHFVRARYTILHLLADLGLLDAWAGPIVAGLS